MQSSVLKSRPEGTSIDFSESSTPTSIVGRLAAQAIAHANRTAVADDRIPLASLSMPTKSGGSLAAAVRLNGGNHTLSALLLGVVY